MKRWIGILVPLLAIAAAQRPNAPAWAVGTIAAAPYPYLPGSAIALRVNGIAPPFSWFTTGGARQASEFMPSGAPGSQSTVVASSPHGIAAHTFVLAAPPAKDEAFLAVASYDDGVVIHDAQPPFAVRSVLGIGGAPADVAIGPGGILASADTDGTTATIATLSPWSVRSIPGVVFADELAFDERTGALFVTDRDIDGPGAITRIAPDGTTERRILGLTSEGLAIDERRQLVYVANVNDGTISVIDASTLVERRRFPAAGRVFSLALSNDGTRLYAVSNQSLDSPFARPGSVTLFRMRDGRPVRKARSGPLLFPIGVALDPSHRRIFVTDESGDLVYVLDANTLEPVHEPLRTCSVPWKPTVSRTRLWIPCARSNSVDVFDLRTLARVGGAPFATGGYPLGVAIYHP